ncbi:MAG TPA: hypothetical protein PLH72_03865 [Vicinamibacterales bacterium]|nr:hypothetical protein [Vicinamibacterales bacterium]
MSPIRTRLIAALLVLALGPSVARPGVAAAQEAPALAGRWVLNRELSQFPREVGFSADWMTSSGAGGDTTAGGGGRPPGGAPGGSGRTSFPVSRISREDSMRNTLLTSEVREPSVHLAITETATDVVIASDKGAPRTLHPNGREDVLQIEGVTVVTTTTREAGRLVVRYKVNSQQELRYTYSSVTSPPQLVVDVQFVGRGGGDRVKRVYEPDTSTDTPAATTVPDDRGLTATGDRGAAQDFDRRPEAQFRGLTALGVVVEGLGTQAMACGLRQDAIESAVTKQLSGAGFKASLNSDEDTYLYVNVMTATLDNGTCVSRYDVYLYTHTTAGLSYHPTPVLVDVSLMHKGSLAVGAAPAHAESVMRGLQDIVGQFATRIRDANK